MMAPRGRAEARTFDYCGVSAGSGCAAGGAMAGEVAMLVADATPYVTAAVGAYGGAVLAKVRDDAADATVGVGRRLLQRVFGHRAADEPLPAPLAALAADPGDADALGMVRWMMRQVLEADAVMLERGQVNACIRSRRHRQAERSRGPGRICRRPGHDHQPPRRIGLAAWYPTTRPTMAPGCRGECMLDGTRTSPGVI